MFSELPCLVGLFDSYLLNAGETKPYNKFFEDDEYLLPDILTIDFCD